MMDDDGSPALKYQATAKARSSERGWKGKYGRLCAGFGRRDDKTDHALKRPATKKRQGTKSRAVGSG